MGYLEVVRRSLRGRALTINGAGDIKIDGVDMTPEELRELETRLALGMQKVADREVLGIGLINEGDPEEMKKFVAGIRRQKSVG